MFARSWVGKKEVQCVTFKVSWQLWTKIVCTTLLVFSPTKTRISFNVPLYSKMSQARTMSFPRKSPDSQKNFFLPPFYLTGSKCRSQSIRLMCSDLRVLLNKRVAQLYMLSTKPTMALLTSFYLIKVVQDLAAACIHILLVHSTSQTRD